MKMTSIRTRIGRTLLALTLVGSIGTGLDLIVSKISPRYEAIFSSAYAEIGLYDWRKIRFKDDDNKEYTLSELWSTWDSLTTKPEKGEFETVDEYRKRYIERSEKAYEFRQKDFTFELALASNLVELGRYRMKLGFFPLYIKSGYWDVYDKQDHRVMIFSRFPHYSYAIDISIEQAKKVRANPEKASLTIRLEFEYSDYEIDKSRNWVVRRTRYREPHESNELDDIYLPIEEAEKLEYYYDAKAHVKIRKVRSSISSIELKYDGVVVGTLNREESCW